MSVLNGGGQKPSLVQFYMNGVTAAMASGSRTTVREEL